ncbi:WXG100 family type VII secretion target [Actinophytocola glycyrrhizae]|uniref:WXG100 family type VII secretion target n=1 Tax=Actinophytocola glycyrrhizae TaxID=2044873 RepID=A0ABV9RUC1_9PSEU
MTGNQGGFSLDPDQLRAHCGSLDGYADRLSGIGSGLPSALSEQSLGSFAQFLTAGLGTAMTETLTAFGHAASAVEMVAGGVRQTVDSYQRTDDDRATTLTGIETSMVEEGR